MIELLSLIIAGVAVGSLYGVLALGVTTLLKGTDVPNFAQGSFGLVSAYVTYWLATLVHAWLPLALIGGVLAAAAVGYTADRIAMRRMIGAPIVSLLIFTLGLQITITNIPQIFFGADTQTLPSFVPSGHFGSASLNVPYENVLVIVAAAAIALGTSQFFARTRVGLNMRASSEHRTWPQYIGVNVPGVLSLTWLLAGLLGGLAGILIASQTYLDPNVMDAALIPAFTAAAIGGFRSILGSYAGGLVLGVTENLVAGYISADFEKSVSFFFLLIVLIIRPQGLFGTRQERRA